MLLALIRLTDTIASASLDIQAVNANKKSMNAYRLLVFMARVLTVLMDILVPVLKSIREQIVILMSKNVMQVHARMGQLALNRLEDTNAAADQASQVYAFHPPQRMLTLQHLRLSASYLGYWLWLLTIPEFSSLTVSLYNFLF